MAQAESPAQQFRPLSVEHSRTLAKEKDDSHSEHTTTAEAGDGIVQKSKFKLAFVVFGLSISSFLVGLDNTIISTAIPKITDQFHALADVGWYASSYLLTTCAFQLTWGKLYTFFSVKWAYLVALLIFELGSLICGVAPNSATLVVGRAIAGVGTAGVNSGAYLLVAHSVSQRHRPILLGLVGGMYGFAAIAGPLLGGAFTDNEKLTWRWCFYINLPLGLITALVVVAFVSISDNTNRSSSGLIDLLGQIDIPGTGALLPAVVCFVLALQWGGTKYSWDNARVIVLLSITGVLFILFIIIQIRRGERATVPPRIFGNRNIWGSAIFGACLISSFFVMLYYIPIWFQAIKGASPVKSGIMNLPMVVSFVVFAALAGALSSVVGYYVPFVYLSVIFTAVGTGLLSTLEPDSGPARWIGYQVLFGMGIGLGLQAPVTAAQTALPLQDIAVGTSVVIFAETLAGSVMVSISQNVFTNRLVGNLGIYAPALDPSVVLNGGATQLDALVPSDRYDQVLVAYNKSLAETFYVSVALACCSILGAVWLQWLCVKGKT
ncbi:major facilitator superfamily domain-containing protein [Aspergillus egyptiacus]|nr:major facilitator superfamily domain-containing protein [Aspergillus egyptiacus]